jgi:ATP-dependent Clp protease ATP-binding subunit ClpA
MFERFTDGARRALALAQEEARLLNHSFVGTEHILLGLISEGRGVAAEVFTELDITLEAGRAKVEEIIGQSGTAPMGTPPLTPRTMAVLDLSRLEAHDLGHNYIGTEHMLLGLLDEGDVAVLILISLGIEPEQLRASVLEKMSLGGQPWIVSTDDWDRTPAAPLEAPIFRAERGFALFTDEARRVLLLARDEAHLLSHDFVDTEHLLLGILRGGGGIAFTVLAEVGITLEAARQEVQDRSGQTGSPPSEQAPLTPRSRKVLELSLREARQLGHNEIGPEDILLGLVREGEGLASQVLVSLGAGLVTLRQEVLLIIADDASAK